MKKLVSIKSDESGELIYFTHKKGVEKVKKSDVVDIELCDSLLQLRDDQSNFYKFYIFYLSLFIAFINNNENMLGGFIMGCAFVMIGLQYITGNKRNSRAILKIYTSEKILEYKIGEWDHFSQLYVHFKNHLGKYLPGENELLLYNSNPANKIRHNRWKYVALIVSIIFVSLLILKIILITSYGLHTDGLGVIIGMTIFSSLAFFIHLTFSKQYLVEYTFFNTYMEVTTNGFREIKNYNDLNIFLNKSYIAIKQDQYSFVNKADYFKFWKDKNGNAQNELIVSENYRDITPIIYEFLKDKSGNQRDSF